MGYGFPISMGCLGMHLGSSPFCSSVSQHHHQFAMRRDVCLDICLPFWKGCNPVTSTKAHKSLASLSSVPPSELPLSGPSTLLLGKYKVTDPQHCYFNYLAEQRPLGTISQHSVQSSSGMCEQGP